MEMIKKSTVSTDKLDTLADKFKELTKENKKFTLDDMIEAKVRVEAKLQEKEITPTREVMEVQPDEGYDGLSKVTVNIASGSKSILKNILDDKKSADYLFDGASTITDLSEFISYEDTENVESMNYMFRNCKKLQASPNINTNKLIKGSYMYYGCNSIKSVPKINMADSSYMDYAFYNCYNLEKIELSFYNIAVANRSASMFENCYSLKTLIIRDFDVYNYEIASSAFTKCYHLTGTVNATYNPDGAKDCYIYVPKYMISELEFLTNWKTYTGQYRALEDYTVDGTRNGELDESKI